MKSLDHQTPNIKGEVLRKFRKELIALKTKDLEKEGAVDFKISKQNKETDITVLLKYIILFPQLCDHQFHYQGQAAGLVEPLDGRVRAQMKKLVRGRVDGRVRYYQELMSMSVINYLTVSLFHVVCGDGSNPMI